MAKHKHKNLNDRRHFLRKMVGVGCASLTLDPFLSSITNLSLLNAAAANQTKSSLFNSSDDYKALVCIMLAGGNDSFNMLVPDSDEQYLAYATLRGGVHDPDTNSNTYNPTGMALERSELLHLNGTDFGLHPEMANMENLFNGDDQKYPNDKYVSFVANVGNLAEPLNDLSDYSNTNKKKPVQLRSHSDQRMAWETGIARGPQLGTGWAGRAADRLRYCNTYDHISMNISLNGLNMFQRGKEVTEYTIQSIGNGSVPLIDDHFHQLVGNNLYHATRSATVDSILGETRQNILERAFANTISSALDKSDAFSQAISAFNIVFEHPFPDTDIGKRLEMVAKSIAIRNDLAGNKEIRRQTYYVTMGGFDNHSALIADHAVLMQELDQAIYAFYRAMKQIGDSDKVTGFTMSDFARTLRTNGDGTDHGWGGHQLVFGGAINGGEIVGTYPNLVTKDLYIENVSNIIPSTSCDEYFADLALWFAYNGTSTLTSTELEDILPNICNFYTSCNNAFTDRLGLFA